MASLMKDRARHLVLALLLSIGLTMPLAGSLDEVLCSPRTLAVIGAVCLVFELASLHRAAAWGAVLAAAAGTAVWIFSMNGARTLCGEVSGFGSHQIQLHALNVTNDAFASLQYNTIEHATGLITPVPEHPTGLITPEPEEEPHATGLIVP